MLTIDDESLPVKALVMPHLGPDVMLIDNSIMKAFGAKLDWAAERLSLRDINTTLPANGTKKHKVPVLFCSHAAIRHSYPCVFPNKYVVPPEHEAVVRVFNTSRPQLDTLALIELKITTVETVKNTTQDNIWRFLVAAWSVTSWTAKIKQDQPLCRSQIHPIVVLQSNPKLS